MVNVTNAEFTKYKNKVEVEMVKQDDLTTLDKKFDDKLKALEKKLRNEYKEKVDSLTKKHKTQDQENEVKIESLKKELLETKDHVKQLNNHIKQLNDDIVNVKKSITFSSDKTDEAIKLCDQVKSTIDRNTDEIAQVSMKNTDLEDRSRRNNLVFYNIPENTSRDTPEDCEKLVVTELVTCGILDAKDIGENNNYITDRAHRLGKFDKLKKQPRPIIVRMSNFRDKEAILRNARKLSTIKMNVSEDFSKPTIQLHYDLRKAAKAAMDTNTSGILSFRVMYRRLSLKFEDYNTHQPFFRTYTIRDIINNPSNWFQPRTRR